MQEEAAAKTKKLKKLWSKYEEVLHTTTLLLSSLLWSLESSDTTIHEPQIRALLGTCSHFREVVVLKSRTVPNGTTLSLQMIRVIRRGAQAVYKTKKLKKLWSKYEEAPRP